MSERIFAIPDHITEILPASPKSKKLYHCTICKKTFKTRANSNYHLYCSGSKQKPFQCDICDREFISKTHFQYHLRTHVGILPYKCPICPNKAFNQGGALTRHMLIHSSEGKDYVCPYSGCHGNGKRYSTAQTLSSHIKYCHSDPIFDCDICGKSFSRKGNYKKHILSHTSKQKPFQCLEQGCGQRFRLKEFLKVHMRTHQSEKMRPMKCDHEKCSKRFWHEQDLRRHQLKHTGEKPFPCEECGQCFSRSDNRDRHFKTIHNSNDDQGERSSSEPKFPAEHLEASSEVTVAMEVTPNMEMEKIPEFNNTAESCWVEISCDDDGNFIIIDDEIIEAAEDFGENTKVALVNVEVSLVETHSD